MTDNLSEPANPYSPGHPWYYVLGGAVLRPKQIMAHIKISGYSGYLQEEMQQADTLPEPRRSEVLRALRGRVAEDLRRDLGRYRQLARELWQRRRQAEGKAECGDLDTSLSLKYCHLYNDLAHLMRLDELLAYQPDLFG